jgi:hypothetical protein
MKVMVVLNIATEAEIANGTRGTVEAIVLDPCENESTPDEKGCIQLQYPPSVVYFKPELHTNITFDGLPDGVVELPYIAMYYIIRSIISGLKGIPLHKFNEWRHRPLFTCVLMSRAHKQVTLPCGGLLFTPLSLRPRERHSKSR